MHMGVADDAVTAHRSDEPNCVVVGVRIEPVGCSLVSAGQCSHSWLKVMSNVDQLWLNYHHHHPNPSSCLLATGSCCLMDCSSY